VKWRVLAVVAIVGVAALLRIPQLPERPMHADEAILADKFGTLLETGVWRYDAADYHGPVLPYLTLLSAWVAGQHSYVDLSESTLRAVPVALGLLLVAIPLLLARGLGSGAAIAAAALTAISPAMVYYSRYYIPEMALTIFAAAVIAVGYRYAYTRKAGWVLTGGVLLGLMFATKETAIIAAACMGVAALVVGRWRPPNGFQVLAVIGGAGTLDVMRNYLARAAGAHGHIEPPFYYLHLLLWFHRPGGPLWSEAFIPALAIAGAVAGWRRELVRFLSVYTLLMVLVYSVIPYKTPWCLLGFLDGMILLAGVGLVAIVRSGRVLARIGAIAVIVLCGAHLVYQAVRATHHYGSDAVNPYAYAPTSTDVLKIPDRLREAAAADPAKENLVIQVASRENLWPLSWYLRRFPHVEWWREIPNEMNPAGVILVSPAMAPDLIHRLYEVPPPGERPLYGNLIDHDVEVRAGVVLRGYVKESLLEAMQ
jgi:predicted membrane-bound mannosyltransferase